MWHILHHPSILQKYVMSFHIVLMNGYQSVHTNLFYAMHLLRMSSAWHRILHLLQMSDFMHCTCSEFSQFWKNWKIFSFFQLKTFHIVLMNKYQNVHTNRFYAMHLLRMRCACHRIMHLRRMSDGRPCTCSEFFQ